MVRDTLLAGSARAADPVFVAASGSPFATGTNPHSIASADFNRDGKPDLATANSGSNSVSIQLGTGAGGFAAAASVPVGSGPHGLASADLNRDGKLDLVVANADSANISILLGNGAGGFSPATDSPVAVSANPWYVAIGDLNQDAKLDLAVTHTAFVSPGVFAAQVSILLGNGAGGFSAASGSPLTVGSVPYGVAIVDLNRDGKPDLAVANQFSNNVSILLGRGDGTFFGAPGSPIIVGSGPSWVAAADLNGDGNPDLAVTNQGSDNVSVLLGRGDGTFSAASGSPVAAGNGPTPAVPADLNGDGKLDLVVGNIHSDDVSILVGNGAGGFGAVASSPLAVGDMPFSLTVSDLNRDLRPDLAVANYGASNVSVLLNSTPAAETRPACRALNVLLAQLQLNAGKAGLPAAIGQVLIATAKAAKTAIGCAS
jgi:hypothetical protein